MALRRLGPLGVAFTAYEFWMRVPPKHRKKLLAVAKKHGTRGARYVIKEGSAQLSKARSVGSAPR